MKAAELLQTKLSRAAEQIKHEHLYKPLGPSITLKAAHEPSTSSGGFSLPKRPVLEERQCRRNLEQLPPQTARPESEPQLCQLRTCVLGQASPSFGFSVSTSLRSRASKTLKSSGF